ncbi:unnamed protein product, partial [Iphiclides podalirius]
MRSANALRFSPAYLADSRQRRQRTTQKCTMDVDFFLERFMDTKRSFSAQIPNGRTPGERRSSPALRSAPAPAAACAAAPAPAAPCAPCSSLYLVGVLPTPLR